MLMSLRPPLGVTTRMLGVAGLLPQFAAVLVISTGIDPALGALAAFLYAALILSFIGGIWWGFAVQRGEGQAGLAGLAVAPSIVAFAFIVARLAGLPVRWSLVALGMVLMLTLLIDRRLVKEGRAPIDWMSLRVPLSIGMAVLTIIAGVMAPNTIAITYGAVN